MKPPSPKPRRNAATRCADSSGDRALMNPTTGLAGCCARAASGHAAAAPPSSVMNSRRRMLGFLQPPPPRSVYLTLSLLQNGRQVLGADLNCPESRGFAQGPNVRFG